MSVPGSHMFLWNGNIQIFLVKNCGILAYMAADPLVKSLLNALFWVAFLLLAAAFIFSAGCSLVFLGVALSGGEKDLLLMVLLLALFPVGFFFMLVLAYRTRPGVIPATAKEQKSQSQSQVALLFVALCMLTLFLHFLGI